MYKFLFLFLFFVQFVYAGKIQGTVSYAGTNKTPKSLKMDSDPICGAAHNISPLKEDFILDENNNFKDVIVWIKNITYEGENNSSSHTINQKGCIYSPHINVVNPGQKVLIKNSDKTLHNVNSQSKVNDSFNSAQPAGVPDIEKTFTKAEDPFYVKCDVHPWMKAWIMVADHPYYSVTDENGKFKIDNVPAGEYEIVFWQEKLSNLPKKKYQKPANNLMITIDEEGSTIANFEFQKPVKKKKK
jgi:plastocyanin